jgi:hypothetical protein
MSLQAASLFDMDFFGPLPIQVEVAHDPLTSDAGLLPLRQFDERIGLTKSFAAALNDPRDPDLVDHSFRDMVRMRVFGILAGYEDQNDHDTLRTDPVFKLIADRSPRDADLASQPTLSRFENQIDIASLKKLRDVFIDQFIATFAEPPLTLTFDLDAVDDPTHGAQQLTLFHGFYYYSAARVDLLRERPIGYKRTFASRFGFPNGVAHGRATIAATEAGTRSVPGSLCTALRP